MRNHGLRGFTLIEVLVALAIVAVALFAGLRAVGTMAQTNAELKLRLLAQIAAENRIAELRAARAFPGVGSRTVACPQGRAACSWCGRQQRRSTTVSIRTPSTTCSTPARHR